MLNWCQARFLIFGPTLAPEQLDRMATVESGIV